MTSTNGSLQSLRRRVEAIECVVGSRAEVSMFDWSRVPTEILEKISDKLASEDDFDWSFLTAAELQIVASAQLSPEQSK